MIQRFTLLMLAFATVLLGQATQGSIYGTITDPSGSAIPNVAVTVKSMEQGTLRAAATNDAGEYVVNNLNIGSYVVSAESAGFKRATNLAVTLTVKARVRVHTVMEVGHVTESVQVAAVAPTIKTGAAEVSNVIDRNLIQNLPVLGRNVMSLAALTPGANGGTAGGRQTALSGAAVSVGGAGICRADQSVFG